MTQVLQRRFVTGGGVMFVLTGIAHALGQFGPSQPSVAERATVAMMRATAVSGMSYWDIFTGWGALYGWMSLAYGLLVLAVMRASREPAVARALARSGCIAALGQATVAIATHAYPPAVFMAPTALVLGFAGWAAVRED
jgi:hypothetical protein